MPVTDALDGHRRAAADRRRRRGAGALRRSAAPDRASRPSPGATSSRWRSSTARARAEAADLRDLPRHSGAERRVRRHARAGHPVAGDRRARPQPACAAATSPYSLAHEVWIDKDSLLARLMRERLDATTTCEVNSRHHQAVKAVAPGFQRLRHRARRRHRGDRGSRRRGSASASSGIRRTSGGPANSGRSSKDSSTQRQRRSCHECSDAGTQECNGGLHSCIRALKGFSESRRQPPSRRAACWETGRTRRPASTR